MSLRWRLYNLKKKLKNCILMRDSLTTTKCLYEVKNRRTYISLSYVIDMVNVLKEPWQRKMLSWEKVQTKNMAWKSIKVSRFLNLRNMSSWTKVVIRRVKSFFSGFLIWDVLFVLVFGTVECYILCGRGKINTMELK